MTDSKDTGAPERPKHLNWMQPWEGGGKHKVYETGGLRCPRCGEPYADIAKAGYGHIFALADDIEIRFTCQRCGLEFEDYWLIVDHDHHIELTYQGTGVVAGDDTGDKGKED